MGMVSGRAAQGNPAEVKAGRGEPCADLWKEDRIVELRRLEHEARAGNRGEDRRPCPDDLGRDLGEVVEAAEGDTLTGESGQGHHVRCVGGCLVANIAVRKAQEPFVV